MICLYWKVTETHSVQRIKSYPHHFSLPFQFDKHFMGTSTQCYRINHNHLNIGKNIVSFKKLIKISKLVLLYQGVRIFPFPQKHFYLLCLMDFPPPSSLSLPLLYFLTLGMPSLISDPPFFGSSFPKAFPNCPVFDLLSCVSCLSFENRLPTSWKSQQIV